LDAHAIIHRAYHALPEFSSSQGEPTGALYGLTAMLIKIISDLKPDFMIAAYDLPGKTFRHEAYENYKGTRKKAEPNLVQQLSRSRDIFTAFSVPIYDKPGFEADDILGTICEQMRGPRGRKEGVEIIIASGDMDTLQLVDGQRVRVFTLRRGLDDTILYDEKRVEERYGFGPKLLPDYKGLAGDPSDNIPGVPGVGEKTATILIKEFGPVENIYKTLKKSPEQLIRAGLSKRLAGVLKENEEEAFFSKMLALIRRDAPIDFKLPEKEWRAGLEPQKVRALFRELDFRSLVDRFNKLIGQVIDGKDNIEEKLEARNYKLEASAEELEKISIATWLVNSDLINPSLEDILKFTKTDSFLAAREIILKEIKDKKLSYVYEEIELPIISIVHEMEKYGVLIDIDYLQEMSHEYHKELSALEKKIYRLAGVEFNIASPKQLGEVLFDRLGLAPESRRIGMTKGGARSTRVSELEKLQGMHPIIDEIFSHRELSKLLSTYIDALPDLADKNGRLHAHFIQHGTTTGRFSSQNPNLQNIPIKGEHGPRVRRAFIAPRGFKLLAFDYSQIELRLTALLSQDRNLMEIFQRGEDVHAAVASRIYGVSEKEITPDMRRAAKTINFGVIYGMGVNALKQTTKSDMATARELYESYRHEFPKVFEYLEEVKNFAHSYGYTQTLFGRRRSFKDIHSRIPYLRAAAERQATNAPLQGTAADFIKIAIRKAHDDLKHAGLLSKAHLILQVHDELVYEVENSAVAEAGKIIKNAMEHKILPHFLKDLREVSILAHGAAGQNWGETK